MKDLADAGHRVTVVSADNFMQYQPFLPEVASGTIDPRAVVVPLRPVLRHATVVVGEVDERRPRGPSRARRGSPTASRWSSTTTCS